MGKDCTIPHGTGNFSVASTVVGTALGTCKLPFLRTVRYREINVVAVPAPLPRTWFYRGNFPEDAPGICSLAIYVESWGNAREVCCPLLFCKCFPNFCTTVALEMLSTFLVPCPHPVSTTFCSYGLRRLALAGLLGGLLMYWTAQPSNFGAFRYPGLAITLQTRKTCRVRVKASLLLWAS